ELALRQRGAVRAVQADELAVPAHRLHVLDAGVGVVCGLTAVVKALVLDVVAVHAARVVLLSPRELHAVRSRLPARCAYRQVGPDLDRAFAAAARTARATREGDERRR